jgi:hypothetical protein
VSISRSKLLAFCVFAVAGFALPAMATPIGESFTLDTWQGSGSQTGPFGTVTLTTDGANVDVDVKLASTDGFVKTGAGDALDFYLANGSTPISSITIAGLTSGFTALNTTSGITGVGSYDAGGAKGFNYAIGCGSACGTGGSDIFTGSLDFTVDSVTLADFQASAGKNGGFYFAVDICDGTSGTDPVQCAGRPGKTGPVSAETDSPIDSVPEPITLSLFGAGLAGAVAIRRRKKAQKA